MKKTIRTMAIASFLAAGLFNGAAFAQEAPLAVGNEAPAIQPLEVLIANAQAACAAAPTSEACLAAIVELMASYPESAEARAAAVALVGEAGLAALADRIAQRELELTDPGAVAVVDGPAATPSDSGSGTPVPPPPTSTSPN